MLAFVRARATERKLQLFAAACCRRIWHLLVPASRQAVEAAEYRADNPAPARQMPFFGVNDLIRAYSSGSRPNFVAAQHAAERVGIAEPYAPRGRDAVASRTVESARYAAEALGEAELQEAERVAQSVLLRHIFGNPFHPYPAPASWPTAIVNLAQAVYEGADAGFALHDALMEAGHPELADHFQAEQWHPKGCWVVDLILAKGDKR